MRTSVCLLLLGLLIVAVAAPACMPGVPHDTPTVAVTVQLFYTHQATFAGLYAADQKGYYADENLSVRIVEAGRPLDYLAEVVNNAAQFGISSGDSLIMARAAGLPLRAVAVEYRRSPVAYVALAASGIARPQDFAGKIIRVSTDTAPAFHAMMARAGVMPGQWQEINIDNDLSLLASGDVQVWSAYVNGFALLAERAGYKLNYVFPDDFGVHSYADTVYTSDDFIAHNPDVVRRFLRATLKGWGYAVEHQSEVGDMVRKLEPDADVGLENARMTASLPFVNTGEDYIGWMKPEVWAGMEKTLRDQHVLVQPLDVTQVYTMQFLQEIYQP
jgi:NitT/TauT family transport system substrate-binding protein